MEDDSAYRWVLIVFGFLVATNTLSFFVGTQNLTFFKASKSQWWGAITSIGLYDSWESAFALPFLALLWFLLNTRLISSERRNRSLMLVIGSIASAALANMVWMLSKSQFKFTSGVSGFEVAVGGFTLVFALANLASLRFHQLPSLIQLRPTDKKQMKVLLAFIYAVLIGVMILTWFTLIELSGQMVNTEVHEVSLVISIGLAIAYEVLSASRLHLYPARLLPTLKRTENQ
jgi:hypothetical protein